MEHCNGILLLPTEGSLLSASPFPRLLELEIGCRLDLFFDTAVQLTAAVTVIMGPSVTPLQSRTFRVKFADEDVADLRQRLTTTLLPESTLSPLLDGWDYGTNLDWLRAMVHRWQHDFDFHKLEEEINKSVCSGPSTPAFREAYHLQVAALSG
jgi:microsomal epoxide hydrolase